MIITNDILVFHVFLYMYINILLNIITYIKGILDGKHFQRFVEEVL